MATEPVQMKGKADVITAYKFAKIGSFAVWCRKDLQFSFVADDVDDGAIELEAWLELLERSNNSHATYRLCLYKDVPENGNIKNTTPYDNCFNFKLRDPEDLPGISGGSGFGGMMGLVKELSDIKAQNKAILQYLEAEEEEPLQLPVEKKTVGEMAIEQLMPVIPKIAEGIASMLFPKVAQVSGIAFEGSESQCIDAAGALSRLRKLVPNPPGIDRLLCRLADLAEKKPDDFAFYMRSLMSMKL